MERKVYVFFAVSVCNIGGAELYMRQKIRYLNFSGFVPLIIYQRKKNDIYIEEFKENALYIPEIAYPLSFFSSSKRNAICKKIIGFIGKASKESIIEAQLPNFALWGELIAQRYSCKNFVYLLSEWYPNYYHSMYEFLKFKHRRKELVGINEQTLKLLFKQEYLLPKTSCYFLPAWMGNSIEDIPSQYNEMITSNATLKIACCGRLEKKYIRKTVSQIQKYCSENPVENVLLFLVGGTSDKDILVEYENTSKGTKNLSIIITGYIFPIPLRLLQKMDFVIAGSGAARSSARMGLLTVACDIYGDPIGVLGISTFNVQHRSNEDNDSKDLKYYISAIKKGIYKKDDIHGIPQLPDMQVEFQKHLDFIISGSKDYSYFEVNKVGCISKILLYRLVGMNIYIKVEKIITGLKKKINAK